MKIGEIVWSTPQHMKIGMEYREMKNMMSEMIQQEERYIRESEWK